MKKTLLLLISILLTGTFLSAQITQFEWAKSFGGTELDEGTCSAMDKLGNTYITGSFRNTVDFNPGPGVTLVTSNGYSDVFISKFDTAGNFVWVKTFGSNMSEEGYSIAIDSSGNIYTIGRFKETVDFDPGPGVYNITPDGYANTFILKLNVSGNFVWVKSMEESNADYENSMTVDDIGNVYITGALYDTADFNPDPIGTYILTSNGSYDAFICKLNPSGDFIWAHNIGGSSSDYGRSLTIDDAGNVYSTGYFDGTVDFDPTTSVYSLTSNGNKDIYIAKYDIMGNLCLAVNMGGSSYDTGKSLAIDGSGNIYCTGLFKGTADFDPGPGIHNITSNGSADIFVSKIDAIGNLIWVKTMGGNDFDFAHSIALDNYGAIYTTGRYESTADFDPDLTTTYNLTTNGAYDIFISKLDANGNFGWALSIGGNTPYNDWGNSILLDTVGNIYTTGVYCGNADFDPNSGTTQLNSNGSWDVFLLKLSQLKPPVASFFASSTSVYSGTPVQFNDLSTNNPDGWIWDFGDGVTSYLQNPQHSYQTAGTYSISLIVSNEAGSDTLILPDYIDVNDSPGSSPGPQFSWFAGAGGNDDEYGRSIATDVLGNTYVAGYFYGMADFDPGPGIFNLISNGNKDIFILKLDCYGALLWAKNFGGTNSDYAYSLAVDSAGNSYITGGFKGMVDFDPSPVVDYHVSNGATDIFILKLNAAGDFVWAKSIGGPSYDEGNSITIDNSGNIISTGRYEESVNFNPGFGVFMLNPIGYSDVFVLKLDSTGNFIWAKSMGGPDYDTGNSLDIDSNGNIYTIGEFLQTADFDPNQLNIFNLTSNGVTDVFLSKLDASGNFVWAKSVGGVSLDFGTSIEVGAAGNIYALCNFYDTVDFDPGTGVNNIGSNGDRDICITKMDASGNFLWAKNIGGTDNDYGLSLAIDNAGNVLTSGYFYGIADFDPGFGTYELTSNGYSDIFISGMDISGNFLWARSTGGNSYDQAYSLITNTDGSIHATGYYKGTVDFDPGAETSYSTASGGKDLFVITFSQLQILTAYISASDSCIVLGESIQFYDQSSGNPTSWLWNFGDGNSSIQQNPLHTYQNPGVYTVSLIVSNSEGSDTTIYQNFIEVTSPFQGTNPWTYSITGTTHSILIENTIPITIDGVQISNGDYIGVFYDSLGTLACGGYVPWNGNNTVLTAWGADVGNDGFASGESFKWKIWRAVDGSEFIATATYIPVPVMPNQGDFTSNGMSGLTSLIASAIDYQTMSLPGTWSFFSTYIIPNETNIDSVLNPVISEVVIVKDGLGFTSWPAYGINQIGNIIIGEGYQIKMNSPQTFDIVGTAIVPETTPVTIPQGWSFLGYLRQSSAPITSMLSQVVSEIIIVKNGMGGTYWPQYGIDMIGNMNPGEGYQIKMNSQQSVTYPANSINFKKESYSRKNPQYFNLNLNTGNNMTLGIPLSSWEKTPDFGDEIGIVNQSGLLVGSGVFPNEDMAITIWGNDVYSESVDGLIEDEEFMLRIWSRATESESALNIEYGVKDDRKFETNKILIARKIYYNDQASGYRLNQNNPNPVFDKTEFSFYLPFKTFVEFSILNNHGKFIETIISKEMNAGNYSFNYQPHNLNTGIYYYQLKTPDYVETRKMIIMR